MAAPWNISGLQPDADVRTCLPLVLVTRGKELFSFAESHLRDHTVESLHDTRVAARRLQALLKLHRPFFVAREFKPVYRPIRELVRMMGNVRELDVFLEALQRFERETPVRDRHILSLLAARLDLERAKHMRQADHMIELLIRSRFQRDLGRLTSGSFRKEMKENLSERFRDHARHSVPELFDRFYGSLSPVFKTPEAVEEFHVVRLSGKPLRYAMEMYLQIFGRSYGASFEQVKSLLELMGAVHDRDDALRFAGDALKEPQTLSDPPASRVRTKGLEAFLDRSRRERDSLFNELQRVYRITVRSDLRERLIRSMGKQN
jgi:CHAD domain-containing protein